MPTSCSIPLTGWEMTRFWQTDFLHWLCSVWMCLVCRQGISIWPAPKPLRCAFKKSAQKANIDTMEPCHASTSLCFQFPTQSVFYHTRKPLSRYSTLGNPLFKFPHMYWSTSCLQPQQSIYKVWIQSRCTTKLISDQEDISKMLSLPINKKQSQCLWKSITLGPSWIRCMQLDSVHCDEFGPFRMVVMGCDYGRSSAKL